KVMKAKSLLEADLNLVSSIEGLIEDAGVLLDLAEEEADAQSAEEAEEKLGEVQDKIKAFELRRMLGGERDNLNSIVSINPGAGGTEAQDWADMLFRMYLRWAEKKGFKTDVIDYLDGEEAGLKSVTFSVTGPFAFGLLKAEAGVHRLVRISPYDAASRRHTSFASVFVYPEVEGDTDIEINEADLKIDTYRAGGAGGQHVNKTDSAVRITHMPSGIVVQCQNERSQHKNKATAMKVLTSRLYELKIKEEEEKMDEFHKEKRDIAWGSQIRSYVLQPYRMVKDHRTNVEAGNVDAVLDGDIDRFIDAFLMMGAGGKDSPGSKDKGRKG
ncbi:MAG: peptide chain release factor 2, partial [Thermodesulfobacteriota bacterium]